MRANKQSEYVGYLPTLFPIQHSQLSRKLSTREYSRTRQPHVVLSKHIKRLRVGEHLQYYPLNQPCLFQPTTHTNIRIRKEVRRMGYAALKTPRTRICGVRKTVPQTPISITCNAINICPTLPGSVPWRSHTLRDRAFNSEVACITVKARLKRKRK